MLSLLSAELSNAIQQTLLVSIANVSPESQIKFRAATGVSDRMLVMSEIVTRHEFLNSIDVLTSCAC